MANLPYDAEVEYLESTGDQQIHTGIVPTAADTYYLDILSKSTSGHVGIWSSIKGEWDAVPNKWIFAKLASTVPLFEVWAASPTKTYTDVIANNSNVANRKSSIVFSLKDRYASFVNSAISSQATFPAPELDDDQPEINLIQNRWQGQIFGWKVERDGVVIQECIPVRFTNEDGVSEGAMYDKMSGQLFKNSGTNPFVVGPDVAIIEKNHGKMNLGKVEVSELPSNGGIWLGKNPVKQVWLGKSLVWERLPYDAEIEWIRAYRTSDNMLDTGIVVDDNNWMFEADCAIDATWVSWRGAFSAYTDENTACTRIIISQTDLTKVLVGYRQKAGGGNNTITPGNGWTWAKRSKHRLSYMKYELTPDGETTKTYTLNAPSGTASPSTQHMVLQFKDVTCTIYGFKAWNNNVLVMDLIPVRVGSEPMFYDKVGKKLMPLTSATDGHVTTGADLNPTGERRTPIETNGYVQDGLVAMWDAKENAGVGLHTQQMSVWKNLGSLGSEYDFTDPIYVHWSNDCLVTQTGAAQMTSPMIPRDSIKTMEVYFKTIYGGNITTDNNRFRPFVFGDRLTNGQWQMTRRCVEWDVNSGKRGWMFGTGNALPSGQTGTSVPLGQHHFSVVYPSASDTNYTTGDQPVRILRDGSVWNVTSWLNEGDAIQQKQSIGTAYGTGGQYISGTGTVEKIYCIRLYNRQLTLEEQQANYALDVQRFG